MAAEGRAILAGLATLPLLLAGCLEAAPPQTVDSELLPHGHDEMGGEFTMTATNCEEGGFVAAYSGSITYAQVWVSADIREEIGNPLHDSIGRPVTGPLYGNWHQGYRCETATHDGEAVKDFIFGRVGQMIEPPPWDPGGADLHFITTGFAFGNGSIADSMRSVTTADITHAYNTRVDWYVPKESPRSFAYAIFADVEKGVYEGIGDIAFYRDFPARTVRIWWQVPADGSPSHASDHHGSVANPAPGAAHEEKWNPVYWDLVTTGGEQYTTPQTGVQFGFHNRGLEGMQEHGVPTQPTLTNIYEHKSLTLSYAGLIRDVLLDELWTH